MSLLSEMAAAGMLTQSFSPQIRLEADQIRMQEYGRILCLGDDGYWREGEWKDIPKEMLAQIIEQQAFVAHLITKGAP